MSVNRAILIGHLGRDPEVRYLPSGQSVANFSIATTESYSKDGQRQEKTEWHNIAAWGKLAEICAQYLKKGRQVYVEGRITTRMYEKGGEKRYATEIVAQTIQFLGGKGEGGEQSGNEDIPF